MRRARGPHVIMWALAAIVWVALWYCVGALLWFFVTLR